jgi:hypothetical protein
LHHHVGSQTLSYGTGVQADTNWQEHSVGPEQHSIHPGHICTAPLNRTLGNNLSEVPVVAEFSHGEQYGRIESATCLLPCRHHRFNEDTGFVGDNDVTVPGSSIES